MANQLKVRGLWQQAKLHVIHMVDGAITGPDASLFTATKNGTGDYSLVPTVNFCEIPYVSATSETADISLQQVVPTVSAIRIKSRSVGSSPAATTATMDVFIYGCIPAVETSSPVPQNNLVKSVWKNSRIFCLTVAYSSSFTLSGPDSALVTGTHTGTGDYTLALATNFAETPYISVTPIANDIAMSIAAVSTSSMELKARSIGSSPAGSDATMQIIVFGAQLLTQDPDSHNP